MKTITLISVFTLLFSGVLYSQDLEIDLADINIGDSVVKTGNRNYERIILKNALHGTKYIVQVDRETEYNAPLPVPTTSTPKDAKFDEPCQSLKLAYDALVAFYIKANKNEKSLKPLVDAVENEISGCNDNILVGEAYVAIKNSRQIITESISVGSNDKVTITISREGATWKYILKGRKHGTHLITYGFGFTSSALEGSTYYTEQLPGGTHQILKAPKGDSFDLSYIPAIFYTYVPNAKANDALVPNFTAGLGFDLAAPVVFVGVGVLHRHNIGLSAGVAFQQQYRLKSQYSEGEEIDIALDKDQLHDRIYRPNLYISINFRFGENPFNNQAEE